MDQDWSDWREQTEHVDTTEGERDRGGQREEKMVQSERRKSKNRNLEKCGCGEDGVRLRIRRGAVQCG